MMKEYIKQGIGFTLGMGITMVAINVFNKMCGSKSNTDETKDNDKPEETVTEEMA